MQRVIDQLEMLSAAGAKSPKLLYFWKSGDFVGDELNVPAI